MAHQGDDELLALCWGKAASGQEGAPYHPVLLHMVDVAAVALSWTRNGLGRGRRRRLLSPNAVNTLTPEHLAFLVAVHDLGKISPGFQAKVPDLAAALRADLPFHTSTETNHGRAGWMHVRDLLASDGLAIDASERIALATCAHHGSFPPHMDVHAGGPVWKRLRARAWRVLSQLLGVATFPPLEQLESGFLVAFAGFVSACDWVGSNTDYFPYEPGCIADRAYLERAVERASRALDALHLRSWSAPTSAEHFKDLFPGLTPTELQSRTFELANNDAPTLIIIEAPTGVGKTEAALAAADQLIASQGLDGMFYGLPTQATSNQMFVRVCDFLARRHPDQRTNLHLVHGLAHLHETMQELAFRAIGDDAAEGAVVADGWFRGRKRTLLAPFAVGTVDQAMLAALHVQHFFVRMLGLSGKVVVIDEVHAYDTFMSTILDGLLKWCRAVGSSVILLSATLPRARRHELLAAWGSPAGGDVPYPRIGVASDTARWEPLPRPPERVTHVDTMVEDVDAVAAFLRMTLAEGGCAAWVCNTVRSAQEAWAALRRTGWDAEEVTLFHARFTVDDRQRLEGAVLRRFSRSGDRPVRHIVVATQVIEQSLDLDFDLMVSQLAPVDLLLQRAGRLHRHPRQRPPTLTVPRLIITAAVDAPMEFGASGFVYDEHILLRTWLALGQRKAVSVPADADALLAEVYDPAFAPEGVDESLRARWDATARVLRDDQEAARLKPVHSMLIDPLHPDFIQPQTTLTDPDDAPEQPVSLQARTRDIGPTATVLCLVQRNERVYLGPDGLEVSLTLKPSARTERALLGRAIAVQDPRLIRGLRAFPVPAAWRDCASLRAVHPLCFTPDGDTTVNGIRVTLHPDLGLVLGDPPEMP